MPRHYNYVGDIVMCAMMVWVMASGLGFIILAIRHIDWLFMLLVPPALCILYLWWVDLMKACKEWYDARSLY